MTGVHENRIINRSLRLICWALAAALIVLSLSGCGQSRISTTNSSTSGVDLGPPLLTSSTLQQIVVSGIGDAGQLRNAMLEGEGMGKVVNIAIDRPLSCGDGSVEATMAIQTGKILSGLFEYPEISSVTITMLGVTQGVKSDDVAMQLTVSRSTAMETDWSMFGPWSMPSMVTGYYINPAILEKTSAGADGSAGMYH